ncbi:MAG: alpha/beta hydrolase [Elainella sp.]
MQSRYRTLTAPAYWAIGGLSSGGWGAVNVGLHHPNHFSILFSHSGYFVDKSSAANSPMSYIKTLPSSTQQSLRIYLDTGTSDQDYLQQAEAFHQELNRLQISNVLQTFPGSHSWSYWRQHLADSLTYVGEQFRAG